MNAYRESTSNAYGYMDLYFMLFTLFCTLCLSLSAAQEAYVVEQLMIPLTNVGRPAFTQMRAVKYIAFIPIGNQLSKAMF